MPSRLKHAFRRFRASLAMDAFLACLLFVLAGAAYSLATAPDLDFVKENTRSITVDFSESSSDELCISLRLSNPQAEEVRVYGVDSPCGCSRITGLPLTIPSRGTGSLTLCVHRSAVSQGAIEIKLLCSPCLREHLTITVMAVDPSSKASGVKSTMNQGQ